VSHAGRQLLAQYIVPQSGGESDDPVALAPRP
jgi:hypothetical protein